MFSSNIEELMIKALIQKNKENSSEELTFIFEDGRKYKGTINSFYETDNGLEMDEKGYLEYYACAVSVLDGKMQEIGGSNIPIEILLEDGSTLWSKELRV